MPSASSSASAPLTRSLPNGKADGHRVALGTHGAVASQETHASDIGIATLKRGGNAVDAAIAVAFALAVTHPSAGNIGGGGFMIVRMKDGRTAAIDYRETAPGKASRDMYLDAKGNLTKGSLLGAKAAGIPGTVAGLALAHAKFGKLPWKDLVAPAIELARKGFPVDHDLAATFKEVLPKLKEKESKSCAAYISHGDDKPLLEGETLANPDLATTLEAIANGGPDAFYQGALAAKMADEVAKAGGIWQASDLASYKAKMRDPLVFSYRGVDVVTMPLPSSGGIVLRQLLGASEILHMDEKPWRSADEIHLFIEAARRAYADRNELLGDPDFVKAPVEKLLDMTYIESRMKTVDPNKATPSSDVRPGIEAPHESKETTHFSVIDEDGDAVSNTYTLNTGFGAKFIVPGTGILLNDEMDDFSAKPGTANTFGLVQGEPNKIEPGKRMLSSMTPAVLVDHGEVRAIVGSPGGPTITTTVAQVIRGIVDYKRPLDEVVPAFRAHHQWLPDMIFTEKAMPDDVVSALEAKGHKVKKGDTIGNAECIEVDPATHGFRAVADTARTGGGAAAAY